MKGHPDGAGDQRKNRPFRPDPKAAGRPRRAVVASGPSPPFLDGTRHSTGHARPHPPTDPRAWPFRRRCGSCPLRACQMSGGERTRTADLYIPRTEHQRPPDRRNRSSFARPSRAQTALRGRHGGREWPLSWEFFGGGERTRTADFHVAKMDRRNPVNSTYANSPLLTCGSTRHHAAARGSSDAPVRARDAPETRVNPSPRDTQLSRLVCRTDPVLWGSTGIRKFAPDRAPRTCPNADRAWLLSSRTGGISGVFSVVWVLRVLLMHIPGVMDGIVDHATGDGANAEGRPVTSTAGSKPGRTRHSVER